MKQRAPLALLAACLLGTPLHSYAFSTGITGYSGNPNTHSGSVCSDCHSGGIAPSVSLSGPSELIAGETGVYTFSISGGQSNLAGFDISSSAGSLNIAISGASKSGAELKHDQPFSVNSDSTLMWQFSLTAPNSPGDITIYAASLSANGDGNISGDNVANTSLTLSVLASAKKLPPTALFDAPTSAVIGDSVSFDASTSSDSDGSIDRFLWDFGDGSAFETGATVSHPFSSAGSYTVTMAATDNDGMSAAVAHTINVSDGSSTATGEALYNQYCAACHGPGGSGASAKAITGVSVTQVQNALTNIGAMQSISITDTDIQAIVDYLANSGGTPPVRPTDGPGLYTFLCAGCHGADGAGGSARGITGAPYIMISQALTDVTAMQGIVISNEEIQKVAGFLVAGGGVTIPSDGPGLYQVFCSVCHGDGGHGGKFKAVTGAPLSMISSAITQQTWMQDLTLSVSQRSLIAQYLTGGGSPPLPSDGAGLYGVFCAVCHGADGRGDKYQVVTGTSLQFIQGALNSVSLMQSLSPTSTQRSAIAGFLAAGGGGSKPTTGSGLYHVYCETCHGVNGNGGSEQGVRGASASSISSEINGNSNMSQLRPYLTSSDISLISSFLRGGQ